MNAPSPQSGVKPGPQSGHAGRAVAADPGDLDGPGIEVEIEDEAWLAALPDAAALILQAAEAALDGEPAGGVVVLLTDDATSRDLNRRFRGRDAPTNVLAFPAARAPAGPATALDHSLGRTPLGDIAVAFGVCESEARAQGKPLADHLRHLVAHGVLHLLGHDHLDENEARVMEGLERRLLARIGVPDPYAGEPGQEADESVAKDTARHVA